MVDPGRFERYVQEALDDLYDPAALRVHPLAALLPSSPAETPGHALHRALRDALNGLKPLADAPHHSPAWRSYRYLTLRYVEMLTVSQVADELGISTRQCRRDHHEAVRAIAAVLWDRCQRRVAGERGSASEDQARGRPEDEAIDGPLLVQEVGRIGATGDGPATSLGPVVAGVVATVSALATRKQCTVVVRPDLDAPDVHADRTVLRQILVEALLFAVDHSARGTVRFDWRLVGTCVHISIAIRPAVSQATAARPDQDDPRLVVGRRLAELKGMSLRIESSADQAVLTLVVPAAQIPKVLVVDDNTDVIHLFRRYLEGRYEVVEATGGERAVDTARKVQPALITLDVMMPSQDGWEVLQVLKQDPATAHIPVVVCSVLREGELALSLGAAEFLPKPVLGPALLQSVERSLAKQRQPER